MTGYCAPKIPSFCVAPKERAQANLGNSLAITCDLRLESENFDSHIIPSRINQRLLKFTPLLLLFVMASAMADSIRCGNRVAVTGDRMAHVLQVCGEPDSIEKSQDFIERKLLHNKSDNKVIREINTERWYYSFNDGSLPKMLEFENGVLIRIDVGQRQ